MKKTVFSLLLTLVLCLGLSTPAFGAGGYQPLTLTLYNDWSVTFSAASVEKKAVQSAAHSAESTMNHIVLESYETITVNLVRLQPGSDVIINKGMEDDGYGVPGGSGKTLSDSRFQTYYTGAVMNAIYQGKAEDSFDDYYTLRVLHVPDQDPYYVILGQAVGSAGFSDVSDSDFFAQPVQWAVSNSITNGTGAMTFSPKSPCTTAQILTFLHRANGSPAASVSNPFSDVKAGDYFAAAAAWASEKGLVDGTVLRGGEGCTRANVVTYLWKAAGRPASSGSVSFSDVSAGTELASAVAWAVGQGITNGTTDTTFSPNNVCTRAEIVTFLYRAYAD